MAVEVDGRHLRVIFLAAVFFEGRNAMRRREKLEGKPLQTSMLRSAWLFYHDRIFVVARRISPVIIAA